MPLNEADTRVKLIDPALHARGWTEDLIHREVTAGAIVVGAGGPRKARRGRADYVLRVKVRPDSQPIAMALIEAKAENLPPMHGLECIHQNHIFRVRLDQDRILPEFASFQVASPYGKACFLRHGKRTTGIASINRRVLSAFPLLCPSLDTQQRIVEGLSAGRERARWTVASAEAELAAIEALPAALLREAFSAAGANDTQV